MTTKSKENNESKTNENTTKKNGISKKIFLVAVIGFVVAGSVLVYRNYILPKQTKEIVNEYSKVYNNVLEIAETASDDVVVAPEVVALHAIQEKNPDVTGFLHVGAIVNLPVVQLPGTSDANNPYLHEDLNKSWSSAGTLFVSGTCDENSQVTLIYGHHMKDGSMFGDLDSYKRIEYLQNNSVITYDTYDGVKKFQVVATVNASIDVESNDFAFNTTNFDSDESYLDFIKKIQERSNYSCNALNNLGTSDHLMILCTCDYYFEGSRYLVVAKELSEGEAPESDFGVVTDRILPVEW